MPVSALNSLRRKAVEALLGALSARPEVAVTDTPMDFDTGVKKKFRSAIFVNADQMPKNARDYFDLIYLPLAEFDGSVDGVALPPVILDRERVRVEALLDEAVKKGAKHALVGNLGHISLAESRGLILHGDFRLNITNRASLARALSLGFEDAVLSPELSLPQLRDIGGAGNVIVYGRLPLMILEKCVGKELGSCDACREGRARLVDRKGIAFPVLREWEHRSVIYNSLPTCLSDRMDTIRAAGLGGEHYIFSAESLAECEAVVEAFRKGKPLDREVRRLVKPSLSK